jgi:hypothetical protein
MMSNKQDSIQQEKKLKSEELKRWFNMTMLTLKKKNFETLSWTIIQLKALTQITNYECDAAEAAEIIKMK